MYYKLNLKFNVCIFSTSIELVIQYYWMHEFSYIHVFNNELFSMLMEQSLWMILFIIEMISVNSQQGKVMESPSGLIWDGIGVEDFCHLLSGL